MNTQEIHQLLEKYYNGKSTEEEEAELRKYFSETEDIPGDLQADKEIFDYYFNYSTVPMPSDNFEKNIIKSLDNADDGIIIPWYRRKIYAVSGIAAACLLLIGSYFFFIRQNQPHDTFSNPEIAYAQTVKILYEVSSKMNSGLKALEPLGRIENAAARSIETYNHSTGMIGDNLKSIGYFHKAMTVIYSPLDISSIK